MYILPKTWMAITTDAHQYFSSVTRHPHAPNSTVFSIFHAGLGSIDAIPVQIEPQATDTTPICSAPNDFVTGKGGDTENEIE
jgi:hypothetical protein